MITNHGFECAPGMRLQAHEQVTNIRLQNLEQELERVEDMVDRLEKRFWLTLYGIVAVVMAEVLRSVIHFVP